MYFRGNETGCVDRFYSYFKDAFDACNCRSFVLDYYRSVAIYFAGSAFAAMCAIMQMVPMIVFTVRSRRLSSSPSSSVVVPIDNKPL